MCISDDRHRVKLHPLLGDPNSDYINANYIDVSLPPPPPPSPPSPLCLCQLLSASPPLFLCENTVHLTVCGAVSEPIRWPAFYPAEVLPGFNPPLNQSPSSWNQPVRSPQPIQYLFLPVFNQML